MAERSNPCLELILDPEHQKYEGIAREAVYRETAKKFPKKCDCGRSYQTEAQFNRETTVCGPVLDYREVTTLVSMRNCECRSTRALTIDYSTFDSGESYALTESVRVLGEECFKRMGKEFSRSDLLETEFGKCIVSYLGENNIAETAERSQETSVNQLRVGLNIFKARYDAWIETKAH